jgi:hypothetical protein
MIENMCSELRVMSTDKEDQPPGGLPGIDEHEPAVETAPAAADRGEQGQAEHAEHDKGDTDKGQSDKTTAGCQMPSTTELPIGMAMPAVEGPVAHADVHKAQGSGKLAAPTAAASETTSSSTMQMVPESHSKKAPEDQAPPEPTHDAPAGKAEAKAAGMMLLPDKRFRHTIMPASHEVCLKCYAHLILARPSEHN